MTCKKDNECTGGVNFNMWPFRTRLVGILNSRFIYGVGLTISPLGSRDEFLCLRSETARRPVWVICWYILVLFGVVTISSCLVNGHYFRLTRIQWVVGDKPATTVRVGFTCRIRPRLLTPRGTLDSPSWTFRGLAWWFGIRGMFLLLDIRPPYGRRRLRCSAEILPPPSGWMLYTGRELSFRPTTMYGSDFHLSASLCGPFSPTFFTSTLSPSLSSPFRTFKS